MGGHLKLYEYMWFQDIGSVCGHLETHPNATCSRFLLNMPPHPPLLKVGAHARAQAAKTLEAPLDSNILVHTGQILYPFFHHTDTVEFLGFRVLGLRPK